ncbi:hypothetical protein [Kitasatospora camelliae]|uniref:Uncharacterized protein n=1 Tax=Kitasatospora camelliae TaxID=3156397 RepID=A0AAU8K6L0_9ACTN
MSRWRTWLQDQPARTIVEISKTDPDLFALVTAAIVLLDDRSGTPVDEWGDLRSVVLTPEVTAEIFLNPDHPVAPTIDVVRLVWVPGLCS